MGDHSYTVGIVVDAAFGDRLLDLALRMPVWIVDTPANRASAETYWRTNPGRSHTEGVTTFKCELSCAPEEWCAGVLSDIDLHHGQYSHVPPYSVVEVFGSSLTEKLRTAFNGYGFAVFSEHPDGFRATIRPLV
ncbi:MAG TPA: hypothetical protein VNZ26_08920 [Vicinamibacterales bacterium]|nr:hypothetical protein [Vicinamibacterales bacterium]